MAENEHETADSQPVSSEPASSEPASSEPKGGRPGPVDQGGAGGMATRENAPEVAETDAREGTD
ncbi:hypothetical protein [Rhodococcoides corynebacterioides]|uniref:hypothetical protein n=1 Tax=Rhodococcoides corynebacterioides TaxID=53972 RepID=UPI001C9A3B6B|nr:hypothetical protein [Rhodococcus corynebacterioides]MBY6351598.1 hypothetical protein [Rhodococcus corynebacterioides]MBY6362460.1 hypothetical protein [Rhodococcus corynebacterioides]